jgi:predicted DNA-binding transcriptional regulator AlpA
MNTPQKNVKVATIDASIGGEGHAVLPKNGFLRLPQVLELFPVSKTTWWEGVKAGRYPPGVKLSSRVTAWRAADLAPLLQNGVMGK